MKTTKYILFPFIVIALTVNLSAQVILPSIFSDGMILQQQSNVALWGKAKPATTVTLVTSWANDTYSVKVKNDSTWRVKIKTPVAGGPYSVTIKNNAEITLSDILIGEVWLASGQSNMEMPLKGFKDQPVRNASQLIEKAQNNKIRFFDVENISWQKPMDNCKGSWKATTPENAAGFSAVAYLFACNLYSLLQVPVGIVECDWGGTPVEAWMSADELSAFSGINVPRQKSAANSDKKIAAGLYNGMIHPIAGYGIKGAIWYQGEQNRDNPELYSKLFPAMVKQWRMEWGIGNFPFYYAQIAPYLFKRSTNIPESLRKLEPKVPVLREVQLMSEKKIKNSGMAVLMDIGEEKTIHPSDKQSVADRLFYLAKAKAYSVAGTAYSGPLYSGMKKEGNKIRLYFKSAEGGLQFKNNSTKNFEIAGKDQIFYPANAEINGSEIIVWSDKVTQPDAVRYAFKAWCTGDLCNGVGLPASSFRTDKWKIAEIK